METSFEQPAASTQCPTCGSSLDSRAMVCAACGTPLATPMPAVPAVPAPPTPEIFDAPSEAAPTSPHLITVDASADAPPVTPAPTAPIPADQKRCGWCGAANPLDADRCVSCNAMFPRPEQDEAMRRAGEARIQAAEEEIALRQRARKWYRQSRRSGS